MASTYYNIHLDQGSDFTLEFPVITAAGTSQSVVGWSGAMQVRATADATDVLVDLTGRLSFAGSSVSLTIPGNVSSDWVWRQGLYDLEITAPDGSVSRVAEGRFTVNPEITR